MVNFTKYSFSFTGASALIPETLTVSHEYMQLRDWDKVKTKVSESNSLNKIKQATFNREFREIKKRINHLTDHQLNLLVNGSTDEVKAMVFVSLLKTYSLLFDFVLEVIRQKYFLFNNQLTDTDFNQFFKEKALIHSEIEELSELTARKVKQVIFTLLVQVGLITDRNNGLIVKPFLSTESLKAIMLDQPSLLTCFLLSDSEIQNAIKSTANG